MKILYPSMRDEIIQFVREFADIDFQRRVWMHGGIELGHERSTLDGAVHYFFDDASIAADPFGQIGLCLTSEAEANAIQRILKRLDDLLSEVGKNASDMECIQHPQWQGVVEAAKTALQIMERNNPLSPDS